MSTIETRTTSTVHIVSAAIVLGARSLVVEWDDGVISRYPWIWLRDHAHDEASLHPVTQQRQLFTATLPADLVGTSARVDGTDLIVEWADPVTPSETPAQVPSETPSQVPTQVPSRLPLAFLVRHRLPSDARAAVDTGLTLWDASTIARAEPTVEHDAVMSDDAALAEWLEKTFQFGFCLATGTPPDAASTEALLRRIGYVRETIFGGMWEFTADLTKADTAYTNLELRPHTDGTYSHDAPGVQLLHCLFFDGTGGESTMVDAFAVADRMRRHHPAEYETLSTVAVPGQYIGDGSHLVAARPVFRHDPSGRLVQVSFNNYDRAPFLLDEDRMIAFYDALRVFDVIANEPAMQWRHVLAPGEAMLFDNWRVLHGRFAFTGVRRMCGGYVNREDVESRARQLL